MNVLKISCLTVLWHDLPQFYDVCHCAKDPLQYCKVMFLNHQVRRPELICHNIFADLPEDDERYFTSLRYSLIEKHCCKVC